MQGLKTGQQAIAAARLLGRLPAEDPASTAVQERLCRELACISGASRAALYWPPDKEAPAEFWGISADLPEPDAFFQAVQGGCWKALQSGRVIWMEDTHFQGPEAGPGQVACLPFTGQPDRQGVFLLWTREADLDQQAQELLGVIASGIAGWRGLARQLRSSQAACLELEQRRAELLHSRDTLRALFDNTPTSMYIIGSDHTLLAVNRCRAELAGERPQRLVGLSCFEALFQRNSPCPDCLVSESLAAGMSTRRVTMRTGSSRQDAILEITTFPVPDTFGQIEQAIIFEEDVTERRRLEAWLAQAEKMAAIGQLAAGVAHEINNPLTAVIANAQLLERDLTGRDQDWDEMVAAILQAGTRASQVVQQLLDLSRPCGTELLPTDVNETLRQAFSILQPELKARAIRLETDLAADLPVISANAEQLESVWLNLLVNAVDAICNGRGEIRVRTRRTGQAVEVRVEDNGDGIPAGRLAQVFEPFYTTKATGRGTGLGLSICHRIVKEFGGEIGVESQPGTGTCFTVILPAASPV